MSPMSSPAASLPVDLLLVILEHVTAVDFIRFGAVCRSWRFAVSLFRSTKSDDLRRLKPQFPWLMFSDDSEPQSKYLYCISDRKVFHFHLPQIAGHRVIGSSSGFLITADSVGLHALNPLTGAQIPLPPASTILALFPQHGRRVHGNIGFHYLNAVICPSTHAMAVICRWHRMQLVFARPGDSSWTALSYTGRYALFDVVFHNEKLYAITLGGRLMVFNLDNPANHPLVLIDSQYTFYGPTKTFLVASPSGDDLFMMIMRLSWNDEKKEMTTTHFNIHVLKRDDEGNCNWEEVINVGELMMFMGSNESMVLSSRDLSYPRNNIVWYTSDYDCFRPTSPGNREVFDLGSRRIEPVTLHSELSQLKQPRAMWFSPVLWI